MKIQLGAFEVRSMLVDGTFVRAFVRAFANAFVRDVSAETAAAVSAFVIHRDNKLTGNVFVY